MEKGTLIKFDEFEKLGTWTLLKLSPNRKFIKTRWALDRIGMQRTTLNATRREWLEVIFTGPWGWFHWRKFSCSLVCFHALYFCFRASIWLKSNSFRYGKWFCKCAAIWKTVHCLMREFHKATTRRPRVPFSKISLRLTLSQNKMAFIYGSILKAVNSKQSNAGSVLFLLHKS